MRQELGQAVETGPSTLLSPGPRCLPSTSREGPRRPWVGSPFNTWWLFSTLATERCLGCGLTTLLRHTHTRTRTDPRQSSKRGHESHLLSIRDVSGRRHCCVIEVFVFVHPDLCCPAGVTRNKTHLLELRVAIFLSAASCLHRGSAAEEGASAGSGAWWPGGGACAEQRAGCSPAPGLCRGSWRSAGAH